MSKPPHTETLIQTLAQVTRRLRWLDTLQWGVIAVTVGLTLTFGLIFASHWYPLMFASQLLTIGSGITLTILALAWALAWFRPHSYEVTARLIDHQANLDERLATAWELTHQPHTTPAMIIEAQWQDTLTHLEAFRISQSFPLKLIWPRLALLSVLLIAIIITLLIPNPQTAILAQQVETKQNLQEQIAKLEEVQADLAQNEALIETPAGQELTETLNDLLDMLKKEELTPSERLAALSEAEQKLTTLQDLVAQESTLNELAETFNQYQSTNDLAQAIEERNMEKAQELLKTAPKDAAQNPQKAQEMAQALEQAAQQAQQAGNQELAQALQEAAEAMKNGGKNAQATQEALDKAAQALAKAGQQAGSQEAMQEALSNIQKAREQLREQQSGSGQSGEGQNGQGQGQGKGNGQGKTVGGSGKEDPTGHPAEGLNSDKPAPDEMSTDNGPGQEKEREYESVAVPEHLGGEGGPLVKPDEKGALGGVPVGEARISPDGENTLSQKPYNEVYEKYNDEANQAIENPAIPPSMHNYLYDYFKDIEPR